MEEAIKYKNVIREYFLEYKNRDQVLKSIFYVILFGASFSPFVFGSAKEGLGYIWLTFPMALALFAAITHTSALPTMLYLVPGSKKLREEYIRRMLKVKIGLPLALCAVIDIILLIVQPMMIKGVILQLVTVFFMSYCVGITNDGLVWRNNASRAAYGQVSYFNGQDHGIQCDRKLRDDWHLFFGDYECGILGCACYLSHHLRTSFLCASQALGWNQRETRRL